MSYLEALCEFYFTSKDDIQQEVIVHLPPKRVFETMLRVHHAGRAKPLIWTRRTKKTMSKRYSVGSGD